MAGFGRDDKIIDIATVRRDWVSSMKNIDFENSLMSTKSCIFVTPKLLSRNNEGAYVPTAFAIGPLHHGKPDYEVAEQIKLKYTRDLIDRVSQWNNNIEDDLVREIAGLEEEARQCYSVPLKFNGDELIKILLVDGCFLIELFHKLNNVVSPPSLDACESPASVDDNVSPLSIVDVISSRASLREELDTDLLLLENQIPWMVLDRLFGRTTFPAAGEKMPLTRLVLSYFNHVLDTGESAEHSWMPSTLDQSKHILDLLRNSLAGSTETHQGALDSTWELIPSASSLIEAGVIFKQGSTSNGKLDIKFGNGVLEIPPFPIHEITEVLFRNLICYEQCYQWCDPRITSYALFLDTLINTPKDVDVLCEKGIIKNWLNPEEATNIFNKLYNDTCVTKFYYLELCQNVNKYCESGWPRWRAMYVRNHFSSPWAIASQVFAAIIFILTLLQTVYSIIK